MTVQQQASHWYKAKYGGGYTADPMMTTDKQLHRKGWHHCSEYGCKRIHAGSYESLVEFRKPGALRKKKLRVR